MDRRRGISARPASTEGRAYNKTSGNNPGLTLLVVTRGRVLVARSVFHKCSEWDLLQSQHDGDDRPREPTHILVAFQRHITSGGFRRCKARLQEAAFWASGGKK